MLKNRVREVRKQRGLTLERLAELAEMSAGHISRIERHEKGWSLESLPRIAKALGVSPEELLDASGAWQQIPVIAVVGQDLWGHALSGGHTSNGSAASVQVPSAYGDVIAVSVAGPALYPRYSSGEVIIAHEPSVLPVDAVGKECVIVTEDNRVGVKFVQKAAEGVIYFSHNEPPTSNLSVSRCYPIAYVLRS